MRGPCAKVPSPQGTTGSGSYSKTEGTVTTTGSTSFSTTEIGSTRDGDQVLTQSGTSRYNLLQTFNNTADGSSFASGLADFSAVGLPVMVGRASVPAGAFGTVGDDRYDYCFAAGTRVVMADFTRKAIETIEPNEMVLALPEGDPTAGPRACRVKAVYHNHPAPIWHVHAVGQIIRTTANHPFFVEGKRWTHVRNLVCGDRLRTDGGEWVRVESVENTGKVEPVFNLQVVRTAPDPSKPEVRSS